ncbi:YqgE/AlgH family protein [Grimontia hollisae]|uniref:YqgE/AlgH family protein n=1 Tax=Grimontia hollisae TaxID=673 RepID=UPI00058C4406|nr:YqgE/AlgH family protein [Grimontia hollisae]AMG32124.1 YqgE/AlgH family protein [Grimontia hollisae]MDF2183264.1 YqgE/AlgH family protein [Grimontia hollisae]
MNLKNHFLVAMPSMADKRFQHSVVYMCEHNEDGAMGLVINQPINISIANMLEQIEVEREQDVTRPVSLNQPVLFGGPVSEDRGFVLHKNTKLFGSSIQLSEELTVTTSKDILSILGTNEEPEQFIVALGYAGWDAGQLEQELAENSWLTIEADPTVIFDTPINERWEKALKQLGIDALNLSADVGHA